MMSVRESLEVIVGRPRAHTYPPRDAEVPNRPIDPGIAHDPGAWTRYPPRTVDPNAAVRAREAEPDSSPEIDLGAWARRPPPPRPQPQPRAPQQASPSAQVLPGAYAVPQTREFARANLVSSMNARETTLTTAVESDWDSDVEQARGAIEEHPVQPELVRRASISLPDPEPDPDPESGPRPHPTSGLETFRNSLRLTVPEQFSLRPDSSLPARRASSFSEGQMESQEQRDSTQTRALGHRRSRSDTGLDGQDSSLLQVFIFALNSDLHLADAHTTIDRWASIRIRARTPISDTSAISVRISLPQY